MTAPAPTAGQWLAGARPRTLPAAVAPVLVGTAAAAPDVRPGRALLALVVSLALQVGVNYANDYSDGVRGADADRVGPLRLVGSGTATPGAVKRAALLSFAVAALAGLVLAALTTWALLAVGAVALAAAWGYTGTAKPYGYRGLGEVSVFVFFGLVAVVGTTYVQAERVPLAAVLGGVSMGALACAILVVNNLRDLPKDALVGKRTLAVLLGDARTRTLHTALTLLGPLAGSAAVLASGASGPTTAAALLPLLALPVLLPSVRTVRGGAAGPALVPVLGATGKGQLVVAVLLSAALLLVA